MDLNNVKSLIGSRNVQFIDFKVVDLWGKWMVEEIIRRQEDFSCRPYI